MSNTSENICAHLKIICEYFSSTCGWILATSPPGVNTTLSRAPHQPSRTGKPQPKPATFLLVSFLLLCPLPLPFLSKPPQKNGGSVQMREVWRAHLICERSGLGSSRTSRLVSSQTATRLLTADTYHQQQHKHK